MLQLLLIVASFQTAAVVPGPSGATFEREAWVMGTRMRTVVDGPSADVALAAAEVVLGEVERFESLLSTWHASTEVDRLNHASVGAPVLLSSELHELLVEAREWSRATGGAFEPVIGALVDAWDLRGEGRVPGLDALTRARAASSAAAIDIDPNHSEGVRRDELAWIDTGGFGKGAALRSAAEVLRCGGLNPTRILVDLGGQIWAAAPPEHPWRVPVADPSDRGVPVAELLLYDVSAATSGTSERWVEVDSARYGHILDPRVGRPVPAWGSVTVVHSDPLVADILSTALFVMGPDEGMQWLEDRVEIAALFLDTRTGDVSARWTRAMEPWLADGIPIGAQAPVGP